MKLFPVPDPARPAAGASPPAAFGLPLLRLGFRPFYLGATLALLLLALAQVHQLPASAGVPALAVGATGGLIIGMITRTARGHAGRALQVSAPEGAGLFAGAAGRRAARGAAAAAAFSEVLPE